MNKKRPKMGKEKKILTKRRKYLRVAKFWPELGPESDIYNIF